MINEKLNSLERTLDFCETAIKNSQPGKGGGAAE